MPRCTQFLQVYCCFPQSVASTRWEVQDRLNIKNTKYAPPELLAHLMHAGMRGTAVLHSHVLGMMVFDRLCSRLPSPESAAHSKLAVVGVRKAPRII
jgi:hypothetical protein